MCHWRWARMRRSRQARGRRRMNPLGSARRIMRYAVWRWRALDGLGSLSMLTARSRKNSGSYFRLMTTQHSIFQRQVCISDLCRLLGNCAHCGSGKNVEQCCNTHRRAVRVASEHRRRSVGANTANTSSSAFVTFMQSCCRVRPYFCSSRDVGVLCCTRETGSAPNECGLEP